MVRNTNGGFLIGKIKQIQARVFEKRLIAHGVGEFTGAQGRILFILWNNDNITISELAKKTGLAKTTLTSMLKGLENQGYLIRLTDNQDNRCTKLFLSEKAKLLEKKYNEVSAEMSGLFYQGFSEEEISSFENMLFRILQNLEKQE